MAIGPRQIESGNPPRALQLTAMSLFRFSFVFQYNATCSETIKMDAGMTSVIIGPRGEDIQRIRAETGAAIDTARYI